MRTSCTNFWISAIVETEEAQHTVNRKQLLYVPGIGPKGAEAILRARRQGRLTELSHLRQLDIRAPEQAAPFNLLDSHKPVIQMNLFS